MTSKPRYIIVAGINGAGKSTLYETSTYLFKNTQQVNAYVRESKFIKINDLISYPWIKI